ncbi:expressed unknown protein [Seminavis robusta]|uniref:Uncharacterized protein n=1 Tax=Seminavis robusta TaxID=568900 RepID=A0A9N8DEW7_9STRA|nr:expressed unknown protein [Seminavis robusta]|eukprot:Sro108_g054140.1 n/a (479) ;mRNA; r:39264-40700
MQKRGLKAAMFMGSALAISSAKADGKEIEIVSREVTSGLQNGPFSVFTSGTSYPTITMECRSQDGSTSAVADLEIRAVPTEDDLPTEIGSFGVCNSGGEWEWGAQPLCVQVERVSLCGNSKGVFCSGIDSFGSVGVRNIMVPDGDSVTVSLMGTATVSLNYDSYCHTAVGNGVSVKSSINELDAIYPRYTEPAWTVTLADVGMELPECNTCIDDCEPGGSEFDTCAAAKGTDVTLYPEETHNTTLPSNSSNTTVLEHTKTIDIISQDVISSLQNGPFSVITSGSTYPSISMECRSMDGSISTPLANIQMIGPVPTEYDIPMDLRLYWPFGVCNNRGDWEWGAQPICVQVERVSLCGGSKGVFCPGIDSFEGVGIRNITVPEGDSVTIALMGTATINTNYDSYCHTADEGTVSVESKSDELSVVYRRYEEPSWSITLAGVGDVLPGCSTCEDGCNNGESQFDTCGSEGGSGNVSRGDLP